MIFFLCSKTRPKAPVCRLASDKTFHPPLKKVEILVFFVSIREIKTFATKKNCYFVPRVKVFFCSCVISVKRVKKPTSQVFTLGTQCRTISSSYTLERTNKVYFTGRVSQFFVTNRRYFFTRQMKQNFAR